MKYTCNKCGNHMIPSSEETCAVCQIEARNTMIKNTVIVAISTTISMILGWLVATLIK